MRRGEIRWFRFKAPDKRRPVLILTRDSALAYLSDVTVAPITTTIREIPTEVRLGRKDGMARDCAVNLDHVQTVPARSLGAVVTVLGERHMARVREALGFALGFDQDRA